MQCRATVAEAMTLSVPVDEQVMQNINLATHAIIVHEYLLSPARHVPVAMLCLCHTAATSTFVLYNEQRGG